MTEQYNREQRLAEIRSRQAYAAPDGPYWAGEYSSDVSFLLSEIDRLQQERDKALEGLRWYAGLLESSEYDDDGNRAITILSDLGVSL